MQAILIDNQQRNPIFMKLGTFFQTPFSEQKCTCTIYIDAAKELFVNYDENNATPLPNQLKVTLLK